jgi:uncharacterized repeat protein (TIGR01451 family)
MRRSIVLLTIIALLTSVAAVALAAGTPQAVFDDYKQCANGPPPSNSLTCPSGWINGILQASNSHYREDQVTPQRLAVHIPKGQTPLTGRTVVLRYQTRKGGATGGNHSYDSLTTWNLTQTAANGCDGLSALPVCTGGNPVGAASTFAIPADGVAVPPCSPTGCSAVTSAHQIPGVMTMYGGSITGVAYGGTVGNTTYAAHDNPTGSNDDYATVTVTYSVQSTASQDRSVLLLFGGHLAAGGGPNSWGTGLGAANINGGPYHIKLAGLDNASAGNRDNQISAGAILGFATITSAKSASPNPANVGQTVTYTIRLSNSGTATGTTNVVDDYDQAHITIVPGSITGPVTGVDNGDTITWTGVSVPPGTNTVTLTYQGVVGGTFSGDHGTCTQTQFPVINNVTLSNGAGTSNTLCVNGNATITSSKSAAPNPANVGQTVTYTILLSNSGNIAGTTNVVDDYDQAHITIVPGSITGPVTGVDNGDTITWTGVSVPPGTNTVTLTYQGVVGGTFSGDHGTCTQTQFPVINRVTLSNGTGTSNTLCVNGNATITSSKSATPNPANVGQTVTYTILLSNSGNIAGTTTVVDDYDQTHITIVPGSITGPVTGVDNGDTITWTGVSVPPGTNTVTLTYQGVVGGTFSGGNGSCGTGQFPVINRVTLTPGTGTSNTLCVNAAPSLSLTKDTPTTTVVSGDTITYTLSYFNSGTAEATGVIITDTLPQGTTFSSCTGGCSQSGNTITWTIASIPANTGGSVTLTVTVVDPTSCQICNQASIKIGANGTQVFSGNKCVSLTPGPNPAGASAGGNATGALVQSSLLGLNLILPAGNDGPTDVTSVDTFQSGVGSSSESNQVLAVDVPPPAGTVLHADVLRTETVGTVTASPAEANAGSVGSAANVRILSGVIPGVPAVVTATLVRGFARATATGTSSSVSSIGSAIEGLNVLGIPQAVFPGARVDLPAAIFGAGSYVAIYEEIKTTQTPTGTSGGTYGGDITVNMIRVHITNMLVVGQAEVIVGHARALATFPQTQLCGPQANQSVSGHAFIAQVLTDPTILPIIIGAVQIPSNGGTASNSVNQVSVDPLVTSKAATSTTTGSFTSINSTATSIAEVKNLCVLKMANVCTIAASLVRSQANSTATSTTRSSNSSGTDFVGLKIGSVVVSLPVAANTVITLPGIGFVILNEQFCDNGGTLASNCSNGTVPGHTGITVRSIHVVLLDPAAGGSPGVDVIVSEAHSDARFV